MAENIRVVIVDDISETREHLTKLLSFEKDIEVVGAAASGEEALERAAELRPDVVLLDINMPGMDGIATAEELAARAPATTIVMMSVQGEADYLRRSMLAGAREFLVKPFSSDELSASIRQVHQRERHKGGQLPPPSGNGRTADVGTRPPGRVVSLFSPKGGVGRTTIAVNLAVAAAGLGRKVVLLDTSFQFGDVGVLLNVSPKSKSIADVVGEMGAEDPEGLEGMMVKHSTGIHVLTAPPSPEMAEMVTADHVARILATLRSTHDLVVADTWPWLHDATLTLLDQSDLILAMLTLEITNIKNIRQFLGLAEQLRYPESKIELLLNRSDSAYGLRLQDVESSVGRKIDHTVVSDGRTVVLALNRGMPFVVASPEAPVSRDVVRLARAVLGEETAAAEPAAAKSRKSIFGRR